MFRNIQIKYDDNTDEFLERIQSYVIIDGLFKITFIDGYSMFINMNKIKWVRVNIK